MLHGVFFKPLELYDYLKAFIQGWKLGENSNPYFTAPWEEYILLPLDEVRQKLNLKI
jgi:ubiquinone biosynthesis protein Coq4